VYCNRIIQNEGLPVWDETDMMLVGQTEVDADENLQLQLWDSGKFTFLCLRHGRFVIPSPAEVHNYLIGALPLRQSHLLVSDDHQLVWWCQLPTNARSHDSE
jgi:hypothetical protein